MTEITIQDYRRMRHNSAVGDIGSGIERRSDRDNGVDTDTDHPQCSNCGVYVHPLRHTCPNCGRPV